ncbi:MAG: hypothetical protein ROW39_02535 [Anaerolineaceae bacterium]|jgi:hypothetical protein
MQPHYLPPNALPPESVRFETLDIEPLADAHQVRVRIRITPFAVPPNLRIDLRDPHGHGAGSVHVIEAIHTQLMFVMHVRSIPVAGLYTLHAEIYYPHIDPVDQRNTQFRLLQDEEPHGN